MRGRRANRRRRVLVPVAAALAAALGFWYAPGIWAYQSAAQMRSAWQSVRNYQGEGDIRVPLLGRQGNFQVKVWYDRPDKARIDFSNKSIRANFLIAGKEGRVRVPAFGWNVLVPLQGDFAYLRDVAEIGRSLQRLEEMHDVRVTGSGRVAGQQCYILRYQTKSLVQRLRRHIGLDADVGKEVGETIVSGRVWVSKATLLPMKVEAYDPEGSAVVTAAFRSVSLNKGVTASVFALPGRDKAERTNAHTFRDLMQEAVWQAEEIWRNGP